MEGTTILGLAWMTLVFGSTIQCDPYLPPLAKIICRDNMIEGKGARRRNEVSVFFHNHGVMKEALRDRSQERGMSRVSYWLRRYKPSACMIDPGDNTWPNDMQLIPQAFATSKHAHIIFSYNVNETEWKIMLVVAAFYFPQSH